MVGLMAVGGREGCSSGTHALRRAGASKTGAGISHATEHNGLHKKFCTIAATPPASQKTLQASALHALRGQLLRQEGAIPRF